MKLSVITLLLSLFVIIGGGGGIIASEEKPNILIIMADDLGYADVGYNGCKDIPTPHIDRLAAEGVIFTSGYVTGAKCGPSRAGFITGRVQSRFGWYSNPAQPLNPTHGLTEGMTTFADHLQEQGYRTGVIGKWHMGTAPHQHPNELGYDEFYGFLSGGRYYWPNDHPSYGGKYLEKKQPWGMRTVHHTLPIMHNHEVLEWDGYLTHRLTDYALTFLDDHGADPFYLFVSYNAPHEEMEAPEESIAQFPADEMTEVPRVRPNVRSIYGAMTSEMDIGIGQILDRLEELDIAENTLVWFLSDNGGMARTSDNRPLRGHKGSHYEGGIRVPLVLRWPAKVKPGTVLEHPVTSLDLGATAVALAGGDLETTKLDGKDISPYFTGATEEPPHEELFWNLVKDAAGGLGVLRRGDYKLIVPAKGDPQLYDLGKDLGESKDLANEEAERTRAMHARWTELNAAATPSIFGGGESGPWAYQFASYPWLEGTPHYKAETNLSSLASEEELYTGPEFSSALKNPKDDPELPNVLLIGDSISLGYTVDVRKLLDGEADVFRIPSNGKDSAFGRSMIKRWLGKREWDVIHFNWGLWDLCYRNPEAKTQGHRDKENGTLTATPEKYRENLEAIVKRLKETEAELVWCETTPVPEKELGRIAGDAIRYNKVANELMAENGIAINELHAHALAKVHEIQKAEGDVHFTAEGSAYLATAVAEAIRAQLSE